MTESFSSLNNKHRRMHRFPYKCYKERRIHRRFLQTLQGNKNTSTSLKNFTKTEEYIDIPYNRYKRKEEYIDVSCKHYKGGKTEIFDTDINSITKNKKCQSFNYLL